RVDPAVHVVADQHRAVLAGALFPVEAARRPGRRRNHGGGGDGAGAVAARYALPVVARGAPRSGRSAPLRVIRRWPNKKPRSSFCTTWSGAITRATPRWKS